MQGRKKLDNGAKMAQPKRKIPEDWHRADIKAALEKQGYSLADISKLEGLQPLTANNVLRKPYPRIESRIASILGFEPQDIWPSRYDANGRPLRGLHTVQNLKSKGR